MNVFKSELGNWETKKRGDTTIYCCNETSPLYSVIQDLHDGIFPNDWIFDKVHSIVSNLADYDNPNTDDYSEIVDGLVDIYSHDLLNWAKTFKHYVDEAKDSGLLCEEYDIDKQLMAGQYEQLNQMIYPIVEALGDQ